MPRIRVTQLEPPEPWERQPTESRAAFGAFTTYRDQDGRRSLRRVAQSVGKTPSVIANWSVHHRWVARCDLWDAELDRVRRESTKATVEEMAARHATMASSLLSKVGWRLVDLKGENLSIDQLLRALELGVRIEREARGLRSADARRWPSPSNRARSSSPRGSRAPPSVTTCGRIPRRWPSWSTR